MLYYIFIQYTHLISITLLQNNPNGEQIQKSQTYFFLLYRIQICRIFTESTQAAN